MNTLVFLGFRATGKTTLATRIAERLKLRYISTDDLIEHNLAMPISRYVAEHGWNAFRKKEHEIASSLKDSKNAVIDCGGGLAEHADVMAVLQPLGPVVWVDANIDDMEHRMKDDTTRPLLSETTLRHDIEINYERRRHLYGHYADIYINTSDYSIEECISRVEEQIRDRIKPGRDVPEE